MSAKDTMRIQKILVDLGWPIDIDGNTKGPMHEAVSDFQEMAGLKVTGIAEANTIAALNRVHDAAGHILPHYTVREFRDEERHWPKCTRRLLVGLENFAVRVQKLGVVGPWRTQHHNDTMKPPGAKNSEHVKHNAVDVFPHLPLHVVTAEQLFTGIETDSNSNPQTVWHVDMRQGDPHHPAVFPWPHPKYN